MPALLDDAIPRLVPVADMRRKSLKCSPRLPGLLPRGFDGDLRRRRGRDETVTVYNAAWLVEPGPDARHDKKTVLVTRSSPCRSGDATGCKCGASSSCGTSLRGLRFAGRFSEDGKMRRRFSIDQIIERLVDVGEPQYAEQFAHEGAKLFGIIPSGMLQQYPDRIHSRHGCTFHRS